MSGDAMRRFAMRAAMGCILRAAYNMGFLVAHVERSLQHSTRFQRVWFSENMAAYQIELREALATLGIEAELDHEIDFGIDSYLLDLAIPAKRIAVEVGGNLERASCLPCGEKHRFFDDQIEPFMQSLGWRTFRFGPAELEGDIGGCARKIAEAAQMPLRPLPWEEEVMELWLPDPEVVMMSPVRIGRGARWLEP